MKINKHGLKIKGLKAASGRTYDEKPYSDWHYMVFYNTETGEVWTDEIYGRNNWNEYHSDSIVKIANVVHHMTMQEIADEILTVLALRKQWGGIE